jgi:hypothetical protein
VVTVALFEPTKATADRPNVAVAEVGLTTLTLLTVTPLPASTLSSGEVKRSPAGDTS